MTKEEVQVKEVISKEGIQEFLVKLSMEFSHYIICVHKFVVNMDKFKECNLTLNVKIENICNLTLHGKLNMIVKMIIRCFWS